MKRRWQAVKAARWSGPDFVVMAFALGLLLGALVLR